MVKICGNCGSRKICGCTLEDGGSVTIDGDGSRIQPYSVYIDGYPHPRPQGWIGGTFLSNQGESVFTTTSSQTSIPGMFDGTSKIFAPLAGTYLLNYGCNKGFNADPTVGEFKLRLNGATILSNFQHAWNANDPDGAAGSHAMIYRMIIGDYVEMLIQHQTTLTAFDCHLSIKWMGL